MDREEAEFRVNNINAIWGIEGMEMTESEKKVGLAYLMGEISEEEFPKAFFSANEKEESAWTEKKRNLE